MDKESVKELIKAATELLWAVSDSTQTWTEPRWERTYPDGLVEEGGNRPAEVVKVDDIRTALEAVEVVLRRAVLAGPSDASKEGHWLDWLDMALRDHGEDMDTDVIAATHTPQELSRPASPDDPVVAWTRKHVYMSDMDRKGFFRVVETQPEFFGRRLSEWKR